jgi:hypothetical protein
MKRYFALFMMGFLLTFANSYAKAGQSEAEDSVTRILFDNDMENVSYSVRPDGFLDIIFGASVPEETYVKVVQLLKADKDINGVLAGHSTANFCQKVH